MLRGTTLPEEAVLPPASDGLHVIVAGRPTMDSAELLRRAGMRKLLDWASGRYDLVLIDTPPSRSVPIPASLLRKSTASCTARNGGSRT